MFIKNEAKLYTFDVKYIFKFFDVYELTLQSSNFICNIRNLYLEKFNNINLLLELISSNCNSISSIYFSKFDDNMTNE
jgi:hypothetical protein